jgi:hypothetical protein
LELVPELTPSRRDTPEDSALHDPSLRGPDETRGEVRLRVLTSLPILHQRYLFESIRQRCGRFLRNRRVPISEVSVEELASEIWKKLLGSISVREESSMLPFSQATEHPDRPEQDGRVIWLIEEVGGAEAISHRYEDVLRERFGRSEPYVGRRLVQTEEDDDFAGYGVQDPPSETEATSNLAWLGLVKFAEERFPSNDDVSLILKMLVRFPDLLDSFSNGKWPISEMLLLLNEIHPQPSWHADRVDNAKRRLMAWISRLKQKNGLDQTDLEALFVRISRRSGNDDPGFGSTYLERIR